MAKKDSVRHNPVIKPVVYSRRTTLAKISQMKHAVTQMITNTTPVSWNKAPAARDVGPVTAAVSVNAGVCLTMENCVSGDADCSTGYHNDSLKCLRKNCRACACVCLLILSTCSCHNRVTCNLSQFQHNCQDSWRSVEGGCSPIVTEPEYTALRLGNHHK